MRRLTRSLSRRGVNVDIYRDSGNGSDEFGQTESSWSVVGETVAVRSYRGNNQTEDSQSGPLHEDQPVFYFPVGETPEPGDRIEYRSTYYELDSETTHQTHASMPGNAVTGWTP
jgi:hypothetical protein